MALAWVKIGNLKGPKGDAGDATAMGRFADIDAKNAAQDAALADLPNQYTPLSRGVLANNTNLNNLTGPANVGTYSLLTSNTYTNAPAFTSTATLEVQRGSGNTLSVVQRVTYGAVMVWREAVDTATGSWSAWVQAQTKDVADSTYETKTAATQKLTDAKAYTDGAGFVPVWRTATAYTAGQKVVSPGGDIVAAIANHTSTTYVPANWTASSQDGRLGTLENNQWQKPVDNVTTDVHNYLTSGIYQVTRSGVANRPVGAPGELTVTNVNGVTLHKWVTLEAEPRTFYESLISGTWSAWSNANWRSGSLAGTDNLDNIVAQGSYNIPNGSTLGKPFTGAGKVDVWTIGAVTTQVILSLETKQRQLARTRVAGVWSAWVDLNDSLMEPTRANIGTWAPNLTSVNAYEFITEFTKDRTVGFNGNHGGGHLMETRDFGVTWTDLKVFAKPFLWVKPLDNGELLACTNIDPDPRDLWLSSGYGTGTVTWTKVLTAHTAYATFTSGWSLSTYKNMVFVAEYGPKLPTWNGATVTENARYVYMSLDYGKTWTTVFDLNDYLLNTQGKGNVTGNHVHGVCWDPYWDRIWVTFGDDTNGILYSDNLGASWQTAFYGSATNSPYQVVGIIAMPKAILFGTDVAPNGVQRISRAQGRHLGAYTIEQAYTIPGDDGTTRTNLCQAIHKVEREGDDGPVLFGFSAETNPAPSFIVATYDGFNFKLLWQDTVSQAAGLGIRSLAGPDLKGQLTVGSNDGRVANMWSKFTATVPIY